MGYNMSEIKKKRPIPRVKAYKKKENKEKKEIYKPAKFYAADFEATVELMSIIDYKNSTENETKYIETDTIVVTWAGLQSCETMKQQTFQTRYKGNQYIDALDSFMNTVKRLDDRTTILFHNLKGYDYGPIIHWCAKNNYKILGQENDFRINFGTKAKPRVIRFFDSLNILKSSIKALAPLVELAKGGKYEIETPLISHFDKNTTTIRVENAFTKEYEYHTFEMSLDKAFKAFEWDIYANEDINILAHVINQFKIPLLLHNQINTQASFAWQTLHLADYESEDPVYSWLAPMTSSPVEKFKFAKNSVVKEFNKTISKSYKGGLTYVNPKYQAILGSNGMANIDGKSVKDPVIYRDGMTYDINSMYPWIYSTKKLPEAKPRCYHNVITKDRTIEEAINEIQEYLAKPEFELGFASITQLKATLKEDCTMPFLKLKTEDKEDFSQLASGSKNNKNSYLRTFEATAHITFEELRYVLETYEIKSFKKCFLTAHRADEYLMDKFKKHCDYWYKIKQTTKDPAEKFMAKLMLNAAYGKVAQYTKALTTHTYKFENGQLIVDSYKKPAGYAEANVAAGSYITAYGRIQLAKWINKIGDKFIYCDTDSLHVWGGLDYSQIFEIDDNKLGALKLENHFNKGCWIAPKTYVEYDNRPEKGEPHWLMHIAGSNIPIEIEDFKPGNEIPVTRSKLVKGGVIIERRTIHLSTGSNIAPDIKVINKIKENRLARFAKREELKQLINVN